MHWRAMTTLDLPAVETIAAIVHPAFPEDLAVFAERQRLYPAGTQLLEMNGQPAGYILSHPWIFGDLPALNAQLGSISANADTYYVHDLALLNAARGTGAAAMIVGDVLRHARLAGFPSVSLVAVNGSLPFWYKHGFRAVAAPQLADKLASYEPAARLMSRSF
ncbi:Predicted N-acetyltransferase YhbS [Devosia sp. YR412]|uniref:GNAT family N-acetyltransferase n=1 Tax=Devosia sp. YR412 TaxID=1881030 RepID=UPI0008ACAFCB|nr:GNAT family N-acetyltransferase [Devosia sp. YR412]SEP59664.1 Predicted N-acetyltransferase YhbS [Devosia sp. YR412]